MDISFERINNELQNIVDEFEQLLEDGKYDEAKQAVDDIVYELTANTDIELDQDTENDNNFHKLYSELTKKINDREASHAPSVGSIDYDGLKQALESATEQIFKTAEIRQELILKDPDQDEYKQALEEGIARSELEKEELADLQNKYNYIQNEIFFDKTTNPETDRRTTIANTKLYNEQLQEIIDTLDGIQRLENWINDPAHSDSMYDNAKVNYRTQIDTMKQNMQNKVAELQNRGLDTTTLTDLAEDANIASGDSKTKTETLKNEQLRALATQYEEIRKQLERAQNGDFTYTDKDGNVVNIRDEEIIRLLPDMSTLTNIDPNLYVSGTDAEKAEIENVISIIDGAIKAIEEKSEQIKNQIDIKDSEIEIFTDHVNIIEIENGILSRNPDDRDEYISSFDDETKRKIDEEKQQRHQDCRDKTYGDRAKAKQYKEAWKRFQEHRRTGQATAVRSDGSTVDYEYEFIEDYPEKEEDLKFMQLESWEEKAKQVALSNATSIEEAYAEDYSARLNQLTQELADMQNSYGTYTQDDIDTKNEEIQDLLRQIRQRSIRDRDYVKNYNSSHFSAKDTVSILATGGSAMMAKNNGGNVTFKDRVAAIFKWTSFAPKSDGKRHVIKTAVSNIAGLASLPIRTLETGIGLVAAGVTFVGSKIAGTYDMPTPYKVGPSARKEARQEYYMNHGSTAFGAWFKSWFNLNVVDQNGNKIKLNEKLIQDRCAVIDESIEDKHIRYARAQLLQSQETAKRNERARKSAYKNLARSAEVYEDIYDEYATVDREDVARRVMQRSALTFGGRSKAPITDQSESFVRKGRKRDGKFVQNNPGDLVENMDLNLEDGLDFDGTIGDTVWTNAVSRKNILRARTKDIDRGLKIAAGVTIAGAKFFLSQPTIIKQPDPSPTPTPTSEPTIKCRRPVYEDTIITRDHSVNVPVTYDNATIGDCVRGDTAYWSADLGAHTAHAAGTFTQNDVVTQGINFTFPDPVTGKTISYSIGDMSIKQYIDTHPNCTEFSTTYADLTDINSMPISQIQDLLPDDVKQKFMDYLSTCPDKLKAINESTQLAYGRGGTMARGWSDANIPEGIMKKITKTTQIHARVPSGEYEWYDVKVPSSQNIDMSGSEFVGPPNLIVSKNAKAYKLGDNIAIIGTASTVAQIIQQGLFPTFKRNHKLTRNKHRQTFNDGRTKMTEDDVYDMYLDSKKYDTYDR